MCSGTHNGQKRALDPQTWSYRQLYCSVGAEMQTQTSQEQAILITVPSLQLLLGAYSSAFGGRVITSEIEASFSLILLLFSFPH